MYALICRTPDEAHCLAVSDHQTTLERSLKAEAKSFLDQRMTEEEQEEFGYTATIANATTRWSDEDDVYPYELYIEETDFI
jgi:hypothetical protein